MNDSTILAAMKLRDARIAEKMRHVLIAFGTDGMSHLDPAYFHAFADDLDREISAQEAAELLHLGDKP